MLLPLVQVLPAARARSPHAVAAQCTRRNFISSPAAGQALARRPLAGDPDDEGEGGRQRAAAAGACASGVAEAWLLRSTAGLRVALALDKPSRLTAKRSSRAGELETFLANIKC